MPVAELNISRPRYALDDPRIAEFVTAIDRVNALAEQAPGFVWRLKAEGEDAANMTLPAEPDAIVNLSVWDTTADLAHFVRNTVHDRFHRRRAEWFEVQAAATFVMWPVPAGHAPELAEGWARLTHLRAHGATPHAFGWDGPTPPSSQRAAG